MALVSSSVPIHFKQPQIHRTPMVHGYGRSSSVVAVASTSRVEIEEEVDTMKEESEKVYVALEKEYKEGREKLIWVLQNMPRENVVVVVHVHRPAQKIPFMGAKFPVNQLTEQQVRAYRKHELEKVNKSLDEYLSLCSHAKIRAEKLVIEKDDIGKGLLELITQHGITKLVMGAATDRQYFKKMKVPKSKTAISVQQQADPSCKIWFVCKGNCICIRDAGLDEARIMQSPTACPSSTLPERSISLPQHQTTLNWLTDTTYRSRSHNFISHGGEIMAAMAPVMSLTSDEGSATDPWEGISKSFPDSDCSTSLVSDEVLSNMSSLPTCKDEESDSVSMMLPSVHEYEDIQDSIANLELEDAGIDSEVYEKLQRAIREAEKLKHEAYKESCRRSKAEWDAIDAARKAKASENLYTKELKQRKDLELALAREKMELEKLKTQQERVIKEFHMELNHKLEMEQKVTDTEQIAKELKEKLSEAKGILNSLQREHAELQRERDDVVREAEELRRKKEEATTSPQGVFSEFTYSELQQATNNFDESLKIGEGGYGSVYKGFLRHTVVAIKMLNSESMQGQAEFYQEAEVLSKVRHPHLVTLIGTCQEAWALVYEFLPQGSLEDRLVCKDNSPPLPWQLRTRIAAEICSALIFLHCNKPHAVVHGDLKPANILLDSNFVCKLGDFGICRFLVQSNTTATLYRRTDPKGTFVYMDPEFISSCELTPSSDVYSFGVILLRLLTGRPALGIVRNVKEAMEAGRLHEIVDVLAGDWPFVQAKQLAHLALRCCDKRKNRPELVGDVWRVLDPMMKAASAMGSSLMSIRSTADSNGYIPSYFICPIFQEIMRDPHIAADGYTYDFEALQGWLDSGHDTSPMTNLKLGHRDLIPNRSLRSAIQEWQAK